MPWGLLCTLCLCSSLAMLSSLGPSTLCMVNLVTESTLTLELRGITLNVSGYYTEP